MKKVIFCTLCFIPVSLWAQLDLIKGAHDFTIDSGRKPLFCFRFEPISGFTYRFGWGRHENVKVGKIVLYEGERNRFFIRQDSCICHDLRDSVGRNFVCMEATGFKGKKDTVCKAVNNDFIKDVSIPALLSRGIDSMDIYSSESFDIRIENESYYYLQIYDQNGVKVFESKDKQQDWHGKFDNGAFCPAGNYYYRFEYRYQGKNKNEPAINGIVRLWRD